MPAPLWRFSGTKGKIHSTAVAVVRNERVKHVTYYYHLTFMGNFPCLQHILINCLSEQYPQSPKMRVNAILVSFVYFHTVSH